MNIQTGKPAPDFTLADQNNEFHILSGYRGSWVLLYFYPKDDTPGCTKEACALRDLYADYKKAGIIILGVSNNNIKSHKKFIDKYSLPFTLLADENKEVVNLYDVWHEKKFMGRTYMGTLRNSVLISPEGVVVKIYESVKPEEHAAEVINDHRIHGKT